MLRLVAEIYGETGRVPEDLPSLFETYAEKLLRPDVTGIDEPKGLHLAIRHLVRESYLASGGDRGLTEEKGVETLEKIKSRLESYDIRKSAMKILDILCRAGIYKRTGENMTFFHDSFESYYAAWVLRRDFDNQKYDLILKSYKNERLSETWDFFLKGLQKHRDIEKLEGVLTDASKNVPPIEEGQETH